MSISIHIKECKLSYRETWSNSMFRFFSDRNMENRSRTYLALDELTSHPALGTGQELIQPIEVIPFDDREYQLQLRLYSVSEDATSSNSIDREKVMDAVSKIRIDNRLGIAEEIIYATQTIQFEDKLYELQVVMTSTRMIEGDKLWNV